MKNKNIFGILAEVKNPKQLMDLAKKLKNCGYRHYDAHSPFPIHGMDKAMGLKDSKLGWIVFTFGILGMLTGIGLQSWASTKGYAFTVSGKPFLSIEAFIPITFELTILFSAFSTVFGMFFLNGLPKLYHPLFTSKNFVEKASCSSFFVSISAQDSQFDLKETTSLLHDFKVENIEVVKN